MFNTTLTPAEIASRKALELMFECIDKDKSFRLEAGAGAGKTYSLIEALKYLINKKGTNLLSLHQQVACISYTNVASDEIASRIDCHPAIHSSTIHSFCWSLIKDFQSILREKLPQLPNWPERLEAAGGIGRQIIGYDELGHPSIDETHISLHHNDVLILAAQLMEYSKFRILLSSRYPILFIDEYQDTDKIIAEALKKHFLDNDEKPLIGLFGDHWQKIYGTGCGKIEHPNLKFIGKEANFRSVPMIVDALNKMRPELPQQVNDPNATGFVALYHTNTWSGTRRKGAHWAGDLPAEIAGDYLQAVKELLIAEGWDFSCEKTKILMLTHKILAARQGYSNISNLFRYSESYIKKENPYIAFFVDRLEPVCIAYQNKRYGEMFAALGGTTNAIRSHADKVEWAKQMDKLLVLRETETISAVVDHLKQTKRPQLSDAVDRKEKELEQLGQVSKEEEPSSIKILRNLREVSYKEIIALSRFIDGHTPFSTKHGVKGAEFENVLVVIGRGWSKYNFNQFLEWAGSQSRDALNEGSFKRNRNLFYVVCSRPKKRLAILFTQELSNEALSTLASWFGREAIHSL